MATIFLVTKHIAQTSAGVDYSTPYYDKGRVLYSVGEYQDGAEAHESSHFCGYCRSNNCGSLYGDPICHELE